MVDLVVNEADMKASKRAQLIQGINATNNMKRNVAAQKVRLQALVNDPGAAELFPEGSTPSLADIKASISDI